MSKDVTVLLYILNEKAYGSRQAIFINVFSHILKYYFSLVFDILQLLDLLVWNCICLGTLFCFVKLLTIRILFHYLITFTLSYKTGLLVMYSSTVHTEIHFCNPWKLDIALDGCNRRSHPSCGEGRGCHFLIGSACSYPVQKPLDYTILNVTAQLGANVI